MVRKRHHRRVGTFVVLHGDGGFSTWRVPRRALCRGSPRQGTKDKTCKAKDLQGTKDETCVGLAEASYDAGVSDPRGSVLRRRVFLL